MSDVTVILQAVGRGEARTLDELLPLVLTEMPKLQGTMSSAVTPAPSTPPPPVPPSA